jgi:HAD superfamily hydrolase (TIGR01549 family)
MNKIKTIIFDFDGTIADSFEIVANQIFKDSKQTQIHLTKQEVINDMRNKSLKQLIKEFNYSKIKIFFLVKKIRKEIKNSLLKIKPFKETKQTIDYLNKKYNLILLSSNNEINVNYFLKKHNLDVFKEKHFKSFLFGKSKDLNKIIKKHNLNKNEVIYIGDEVRDIEACKQSKIKIVSCSYGYNSKSLLEKSNPNYLIDNIKDLKKIF